MILFCPVVYEELIKISIDPREICLKRPAALTFFCLPGVRQLHHEAVAEHRGVAPEQHPPPGSGHLSIPRPPVLRETPFQVSH